LPKPVILIVDDDTGSRQALEDILRDEGYAVATASDGGDALNYLRAGHRPRVILLDLMMPGIDGWDFYAEQKRNPDLASIPVIAISAAGKLVDAPYSLRKPIDVDQLLKLLHSILGGPDAAPA